MRQKNPLPPRLGRFADDDLGDVATAGEIEQRVGDIAADEGVRFGAELLGESKIAGDSLPQLPNLPVASGVDGDGHPLGAHRGGHALGGADDLRAAGAGTDADQQPLGGGPGTASARARRAASTSRATDGGLAERQFAQRDEIAALEKIVQRPLGLRGQIDFAGLEARGASSGVTSTSSISSARSRMASGRVSRTMTLVICAMTSLRLSMCWTLSVVQTLMPASSSSSMSFQRLAWREPSTLVWASSSTRISLRLAGQGRV